MKRARRGKQLPVEDDYRAAASQGLTLKETAVALGVSYNTVQAWSKRLPDVDFADAREKKHRARLSTKEPRQ